ncbi:MAG: hypothetical protein KatS3mg001_545 [Candidatus Pacearchaeota archaeon]|nr:MAG: hypothetical protein KatS3mg001_545 [Candidatus Pacearchaeota archaeon]
MQKTLFFAKRKMENKIEKKAMVFFLALAGLLFFAGFVSAASLGTITKVEVDGVDVSSNPAIVAGKNINVRVEFVSDVNVSNVQVRVELETKKKETESRTSLFDVETGKTYSKTLNLEVPFDLRDFLSDDVTLNVKISGDGFSTEAKYTLRVQRESFDLNLLSVNVPQTARAGEIIPVDVVLRNTGYNNLRDLFVTVKVNALGIEKSTFFGDVVALECDEDSTPVENYGVDISRKCDEDDLETVNGRVFVQIPFSAKSGKYALEVIAENEDLVKSKTLQIEVKNAFSSGNFIVSGNQLLIVNPTNELVVYRLLPEASTGVSVKLSENLVAVPAGSSKTVTIEAVSKVSGTQVYSINILSPDGKLVDTVTFSLVSQEERPSVVVVLTIILAIVFVVLLVVLIVLLGKKPEKEEFGESYY